MVRRIGQAISNRLERQSLITDIFERIDFYDVRIERAPSRMRMTFGMCAQCNTCRLCSLFSHAYDVFYGAPGAP